MIRIVQTEITSRLSQLFRRQPLERGLGCNGHEHGQWDGAMGQRQDRSTGLCGLFGNVIQTISVRAIESGNVLISKKY